MGRLRRQIEYKLWVEDNVIKLQFISFPEELLCISPGEIRIRLPGRCTERDGGVTSFAYSPERYTAIEQALKQYCHKRSWEVAFTYSRVAQMRRGIV